MVVATWNHYLEVMVSSRRIPKGPGGRPKSLARREFMGLIARGWPLATAAREVGISRSAAYLWRDGATVRDKDGSVRHVAPLEPLALKPISPRFLSEEERIRIADLASRGVGPTVIGVMVGRSASTVSRERRRNRHDSGQYRPFHAHRQAALRRRRPKPIKIETNEVLREYVSSRLSKKVVSAANQLVAEGCSSRGVWNVCCTGEYLFGHLPAYSWGNRETGTLSIEDRS